MTTLPADLSANLLSSTQGQWWQAKSLGFCVERRVELVASQMGHFLWTASFRNDRTGQHLGQRFFVTLPKSDTVLAVFDNLADREAWLVANWEAA